jgi:hypothetical protein
MVFVEIMYYEKYENTSSKVRNGTQFLKLETEHMF